MIVWPRAALIPRNIAVAVSPANAAGPPSLSGFRQTVGTPAGTWSIRYESVPVVTRNDVQLWRAIEAMVEGRLVPIEVPIHDSRLARPFPAGVSGSLAPVPHSDGALHSDGAGYASSAISVAANSVVGRGATAMRVALVASGDLQPGMHFSVGSRLYRIKSATVVSPAIVDLTFWPPARDAILAGAGLDFETPVCKCRLASDDAMALMLGYGRFGSATIAFTEDPT